MQRNEVFYLQNNLLFPQFIHSYTGFLDLVTMAPGSIAMNLAEQPDHFTKTRALGQKVMREGNNNKQTRNKTRRPGTMHSSRASILSSVWIQKSQSKCWMNPFSGSSFTQQTLLIIASANIVFSLGDIRKCVQRWKGYRSTLKEKAASRENEANTSIQCTVPYSRKHTGIREGVTEKRLN